MSERGMRVTVEDLETGEKQERVIPPGEYVLVTTEPCWLSGAVAHKNGTVVLTVKDHRPSVPAPCGEMSADTERTR